MELPQQIEQYIASLPTQKQIDILNLHQRILKIMPDSKLWFLDGKNSEGKIIANPNIGYGCYKMSYADGSSREFYRIGLSANTTGISLYVMGIENKNFLAETYGKTIGKATVTGYCIKFKMLNDIKLEVLEQAIHDQTKPQS